ncbi:DUF4129 domain-containing protein, partial [uncultured Thiodictyon sp.]
MELDRITIALRPRGVWERLDLGFALARAWFPTLWALWWLSVLPVALLALLLSGARADWWGILVWWFKPLYEAPLVWWISRALFGEPVPLRAAPGMLRAAWTRRLLPYLLWRRLTARRSFVLPIGLLEGLGGKALRARRRLLSQGAGAAWLTLICYHFEAILWGGLLLALYYMIPEGLPGLDLEAALTDSQSWPYWVSAGCYLLAGSVIAPFYVCGGFALYIGRRTELEAWDLELAFRRVHAASAPAGSGAPRPRTASGRAAALTGLACVAVLLAWPGPPAHAKAVRQPLPEPEAARTLITEVLADDTFGHTRQRSVWTYIGEEPKDREPSKPRWFNALGDLAVILGRAFKALLAVLAVAALALLLQRILRDWQPGSWRRRARPAARPTGTVASLDAAADPGAADLAQAVRARLAAGDARGALALLYRGGIAHLRHRGVAIPDGATEGECLHLAADHLGTTEAAPFRQLTRDWQALAYAQRTPEPQTIAARLADWLRWTGVGAEPEPRPNGSRQGAKTPRETKESPHPTGQAPGESSKADNALNNLGVLASWRENESFEADGADKPIRVPTAT